MTATDPPRDHWLPDVRAPTPTTPFHEILGSMDDTRVCISQTATWSISNARVEDRAAYLPSLSTPPTRRRNFARSKTELL